ncbi:hypothetical protein GCM10027040_13260 [Halomonas shantousis]
MADTLYRLVYLSRNAIPGDSETQRHEIERILAISRHKNPSAGVNGALLFNADRFAQVLEGPRHALETLFECIQCDPRHTDIVVLIFEPIAQCSFSQWAMGYVTADSDAPRHIAALDDQPDTDTRQQIGERVYALLQTHLLAGNGDKP